MKKTLIAAALISALPLIAQKLTLDHPDGIYDSGKDEKIVLTIEADKHVCVKTSANTATHVLAPGTNMSFAVSDLKTNWFLAEVWNVDEKQRRIGPVKRIGALIDPYKIKAGAPDPADFDEFWEKELGKMRSVPMNPVLEEVKLDDPRIRSWKFKLDCGDNNFAYGYISMPAKADAKSLPAIAQFHGASTMGLPRNNPYYAYSAIHVTMSPHQSECGRDGEYYKQIAKEVFGYTRRGVESRDTYYMKGMILRVLRTLEFIKTYPEWDGKNLLTHGESQGGFQALAGAALDKDVSFCLAMVPAMSDHFGYKQGNKSGWPQVIQQKNDGSPANEKLARTVENVLPYFDNVNFAKRIKCPVWISTGLQDTVCPPSGVLAVYNNLPAETEKHLYISPKAGHDAGYPGVVTVLHSLVKPPPAR